MPTELENEVAALQAALAGEHAAVWGYGVLGPRLGSRSQETAAQTTYRVHRALRDELAALVQAREAVPTAAAPSYELPFPVADRASARRLAIHLEDGLADLYGDLVAAAATPALRARAASALASCAVRRVQWGGVPQAFPGMPERRRPATPPPSASPSR